MKYTSKTKSNNRYMKRSWTNSKEW